MKQNNTLINNQIKLEKVLVINSNGQQLGEMSSDEATEIAINDDLDLVLIVPNANPPVCKIMDYNKFKFEQSKKAKEMKKNQKETIVKEIQLSFNIDEHDFQTKLKNARKFLTQNNRVYVTLRLKGRQNAFVSKAMEVANRFSTECNHISKLSKPISHEGNTISFLLLPL
jgi:translation initiation factor IF-3